MRLYGSLSRLVNVLFRKDNKDITLRPNQVVTYSADRDIQLPPQNADAVLVSESATQTLSGKTMSGSSNTFTNIPLSTGVTGILAVAHGGTNSSSALSNNRVMQSSGGEIVEASAITAARALISDANGIPVHSTVTSTELGYVSGVTSSVQTQIDAQVLAAGDTMTGNLVMANQKEVRFSEATGNGTNYTGIQAAASIASDHTYTLPAALPGTSGFVLASTTGGTLSWVNNAAVSSFDTTWAPGDGATKSVVHSLGTRDVIVQIYDENYQTVQVDLVTRTDTNTVDLTSSEAPASNWRVLILST